MKKSKGIWYVFVPVILIGSLYVVFYSTIESKPSDAGFWFIFTLGISCGVALTRIIQWLNHKKTK